MDDNNVNAIATVLADRMATRIAEAIKEVSAAPQRLANRAALMDYFDVESTTLDRIVARPGFPDAIKIPNGPLRWVFSEVVEWAESQRGTRAR
ncbi:MAG TPA: hypothetical protein PKZ20_10165 [Rhodocyclaceae bacterium]|nr:hypothetical protein [Rhodocyclaceae bacterium]